MTEFQQDDAAPKAGRDQYVSTNYSNKIVCGICGAPLRNVPTMYEKVDIDWRCGKCLRKDKMTREGAAG